MSQVDNFVKARGRRVRIYDYNGRMQIDHKKLIGSVGIMLQQDENTAVIFCPAVNLSLDFSHKEYALIWNVGEIATINKFHQTRKK